MDEETGDRILQTLLRIEELLAEATKANHGLCPVPGCIESKDHRHAVVDELPSHQRRAIAKIIQS